MYRPCLHCNKKNVDNFNSKFCPTGCEYGWDKTELKKYEALGDYDRLRALAEADRDGRCVVLEKYPAKNRYEAADYLSDWVKEAEFEDREVGIYAIQSDVGDVVHGVIDALNAGRPEAEAALGKEQK